MKYCCKICGRLNSADNWIDGHLKCSNCGQLIKSTDNAVCIGQFIDERYELKKLLEQRTNTNIYIAFDLFKQCPVLLRLYFWDFTYSVTSHDDFLEVAQSVSYLAQPQHMKITHCGHTRDGMIYTIWPYENLESLSKLLQLNGPFEVGVALNICRDIASCLDQIHQETGMGHYNLNTNKIYLNNDGEVKLSDLGQAAFLLNDAHFINEESEYFNERFLAPEIILDEQKPNLQSDMFSLGACLYFMLTGKRPFESLEYVTVDDYEDLKLTKAHELRLSSSTVNLLYKLLSISPKERFDDWFDVISQIKTCLNQTAEGKTVSCKAKLTTKFEFDFLTEFHEEKYDEAQPKLLSATAVAANLKIQRPLKRRKRRKPKVNYLPIKTLLFAAISIFAFTLLFLYQNNSQQNFERLSSSTINQTTVRTEDKSPVNNSPSNPTNHSNKPKNLVNIEVEEKNFQKMKVKPKINTPQEVFRDLKFEVREYTLQKKWQSALNMIASYDGPFVNESLLLKEEVQQRQLNYENFEQETKKREFNGNMLFAVKNNAVPSPRVFSSDENDRLKRTLKLLLKREANQALDDIKLVEESLNIDLSFFTETINLFKPKLIQANIVNGYKNDFGKKLKLKLKRSYFEGTLLFLDSELGELTLTSNKDNKNHILKLKNIHHKENYLRINHENSDKAVLMQTLYLLENRDLDLAKEVINSNYNGPLKGLLVDLLTREEL